MDKSSEEGYYDTPISAADGHSDALYDTPMSGTADCSNGAPVIQNNHTITAIYENTPDNSKQRANVPRNERDIEVKFPPQESKDSKGKRLSKAVRRLINILLVVLVIGLACTTYLLYSVRNELQSNKEITSHLKSSNQYFLDLANRIRHNVSKVDRKHYEVLNKVNNVKEVVEKVVQNVSDMTSRSEKRIGVIAGKIEKNISIALNVATETEKNVASVRKKVDDVSAFAEKTAKNITMLVNEGVHRINKVQNEVNKNISEIRRISNELNDTMYQMHMLQQFRERYQKKFGISFQDVIRLSKQYDYKVNNSVAILRKLDDTYYNFTKTYQKKWGIQFKDFVTLATGIDTGIKEIETLFTGFEDLWGTGSFKGFVDVVIKRDEKTRSDIMASIGRIKQKEKLKFVPTPSGSTTVPTNFGYQERDGKFFATGYVKMYYEQTWCPIYYFYYTDNGSRPYYSFGNKEANVTCRTGGYATGTFIGSKKISNLPSQLWIDKLKCTGNELTINECIECETKNYEHWRSSVEVKCYL